MNLIPIDEVVHFDVVTSTPATGAAVDADSAPTFDVFEEGTDTPILDDQAMTKRTSLTGNYRGSFTASAANGFEAGKWYSVVVSAIVGGVTGKCTAMHFRAAPAETTAGVPQVRASAIADGAIAAATLAADTITAAKVAADVTTELQAGLATAAAVATLQTSVDDLPTNAELATSQAAADDATLAAIASLQTTADDIPTNAELATALAAADDAVLAQVALVKAKTGALPADPADASDIAASHNSLASTLATIASLIDTEIAAILAAVDTEIAAIKAKTDNLPAAPAAVGDIPTAVQNADALLGRNIAGGSSAGRTVTSALRRLRNRIAIAAGTMTTYAEDDTTPDHTAAVTTAAGNPITEIDPA
jgi:hypothetical protein